MSASTSRPGLLRAGRVLLLCGVVPAVLTVILSAVADLDWSSYLRAVFSAVVYAPVAAIALSRGRIAVALCTGALSVSSGMVVLADALTGLLGPGPLLLGVLGGALLLLQQSSTAMLAIMPWLFVRHPVRRIGIAVGLIGVLALTVLALLPGEEALIVYQAQNLFNMTAFLVAAVMLARQWWRGTPAERQTFAWFVFAAVLVPVSFLNLFVSVPLVIAVSDAAFVLGLGFLPTAILAAIVGDSGQLLDRRLVSGVVWAQSLAIGASLFLFVDVVAGLFGASEWISGAVAAVALALGFSSVLRVMRRRTTVVFFGPGADPRAVLSALGARLDGDAPGDGLHGIAASLREIWHLDAVEIAPAGGEAVVASASVSSSAPRAALERQLTTATRTVGAIHCVSTDRELLRSVVDPAMDRIGPFVAVAVLLATANQEVATARERMLDIRARERRMLHRELHDDLAPALAGIGFGMAGARRQIAAGEPRARDAVARLRGELAGRAEGVRRLARALLPAALDAGDLEGAMRELAGRFSGTLIEVSAPGTDVLDAETQLSAYLLLADVLEAILPALGPCGPSVTIAIAASGDGAEVRQRLRFPRPSEASCVLPPEIEEAIRRRCAESGGTLETRRDGLDLVVPG